jgi:asparagine synthase (glutamine-hydrolysing)
MTMAHGLEARSPFMDHKLAEFAARLPTSLKVKGRRLRYLQVRLAERYLPSEVLKRPKQGFSSALPYMVRDELRLLAGAFLTDSHLVRDGFYTQAPVRRVLEEHLQGRSDHGNRLWLLLNSEVWYRMLLEHATSEDLLERITAAQKAIG